MNWIPGEDYYIRLTNKTADNLTEQQIQEMIEKIQTIAEKYDFGLGCHGSWKSFKIIAAGEDEIINKYKFKVGEK